MRLVWQVVFIERRKKFHIPGIGMRNLKTALAVVICMSVYAIFGAPTPFYACIAAIICMQDTVENTVRFGLSRLLGTCIGGLLGLSFLWLDSVIGLSFIHIFLTGIGVAVAIYLGVLFNNPNSCTIAAAVLCAVMLNNHGDNQFIYAINRIGETFFGIIVAVIINRLINPAVSSSGNSLKWSGGIARTDLEEDSTLSRTKLQRKPEAEDTPDKETDGELEKTEKQNEDIGGNLL